VYDPVAAQERFEDIFKCSTKKYIEAVIQLRGAEVSDTFCIPEGEWGQKYFM
jgi:hypothetical protein